MNRLTIAIPTFNRADLLRRALESALAQTSPDIEILVSDNGSSDGTATMLAAYNDARLRKVRHDITVPRAQHGTWIFNNINTEFVTILSDDDWLEPAFSIEVLKLYDENAEISFIYTGCIEHYDDVELPAIVGPRIESSLDFFAAHYAGKRQVSWCACALRVADILHIGPQPDDRILGDMFFWTKIGFKGPVGCVAQPLSHYVVLMPGGNNESKSVPIKTWAAEEEILCREVLGQAKVAGASADYQAKLVTDMQRYVYGTVANQFVWARLYGASRIDLLKSMPPYILKKGWAFGSAVNIAAAIVSRRSGIRYAVRSVARKFAKERQS